MTDALGGVAAGAAGAAPGGAAPSRREEEILKSAKAFEAVFVAQMLSQSGLGKAIAADGGFGGEAFSSLLIEQYADKLVEKGGFGLAERIYEQLRREEAPSAEKSLP